MIHASGQWMLMGMGVKVRTNIMSANTPSAISMGLIFA
jgi:hypothetical protein